MSHQVTKYFSSFIEDRSLHETLKVCRLVIADWAPQLCVPLLPEMDIYFQKGKTENSLITKDGPHPRTGQGESLMGLTIGFPYN